MSRDHTIYLCLMTHAYKVGVCVRNERQNVSNTTYYGFFKKGCQERDTMGSTGEAISVPIPLINLIHAFHQGIEVKLWLEDGI